MITPADTSTVLGLDIGTSSVGWGLVEYRGKDPRRIVAAGARVFPAGLNLDQYGTGESRNLQRREARLRRRMLDRRRRRKGVTLRLLFEAGFAPSPRLDKDGAESTRAFLAVDPYAVRSAGLERKLARQEFGRAILHIAQRRGFQSNRKRPVKADENSVVRADTDRQAAEMQVMGCQTFGQFLFRLRGTERDKRIRERYTLRAWYRTEFETLCERQSSFGLEGLTDELIQKLKRAIFFQRRVYWKRSSIGRCSLEPMRYRGARALLVSQRFRILQDVNHARLVDEAGRETPLTGEQRAALIERLESARTLSFAKARKLVGAPHGSRFNLEAGDRSEFRGNDTAASIRGAVGDAWDTATPETRDQIVEALMSMEDEDALASLARRKWNLPPEQAEALSQVSLEEGHAAHSTKAMRRLLPHLETGMSYMEALQAAYPSRAADPQVERLPPLENVRNPMVQRSLAEVRRVVNAIVATYGRPDRIRIELARDLKKNAKTRDEIAKAMRAREKERKSALQQIVDEAGLRQSKATDIEKVLLWRECRGTCPYTGKGISFKKLFDEDSEIDIEHIIPFSRSLDNSFANKTLCYAQENRHIKHDRTPFEAYGGQPDRWAGILTNVRSFEGKYRDEKLRRFLMEKVDGNGEAVEQFATAQLNDTRYATRRAAEYVALLYAPKERASRVQVSIGQTTAYLRSAWGLNSILSTKDKKSRDDHRHHAIDAIVIALTIPGFTRALAESSKRSFRPGSFPDFSEPWDGFRADVAKVVDGIVVSHRVDHKVNGPLHDESFYGLIRSPTGDLRTVIRKKIADLSDAEIRKELIVDKAVREAVEAKLKEHEGTPAEVFQDSSHWPVLETRTGRKVPIRRVRVFRDLSTQPVGAAPQRNIATRDNHHLEVFESRNSHGATVWAGSVVSRLEAMIRKKTGGLVVRPSNEKGEQLVMSLAIGDTVELSHTDATDIVVVLKLSAQQYVFRVHTDARMVGDAKKAKGLIYLSSGETLRKAHCKKLNVSPLGIVHVAQH